MLYTYAARSRSHTALSSMSRHCRRRVSVQQPLIMVVDSNSQAGGSGG